MIDDRAKPEPGKRSYGSALNHSHSGDYMALDMYSLAKEMFILIDNRLTIDSMVD